MNHQNKTTAAYRLFHRRYVVRMPKAFMYSPEYIRKVGYPVSGDPQIDRTAATDLLVINMTGAGLTMLHAKGAPLDFINVQDVVPLFNDIQEHLRDWERVTYQGIHPDLVPPLEEFRQFEAVAMDLYTTAMHYKPEQNTGSRIRDFLMEMNMRRNPEGTNSYLRAQLSQGDGAIKPYESIVDRIETNLLED